MKDQGLCVICRPWQRPSEMSVQGMKKMADKILFVDDEPSVLDGYRRMLHREFEVDTANSGDDGLTLIRGTGPYAVVVSDMRMPGMNGAKFLAQVRQLAPDTVRILLTGYSDMDAAIDAVNEGNIFRYLTKPCQKEVLVKAINLSLDQYRTVTAEKMLVKKAQKLERATSENDYAEVCLWDNGEGPTGLPGPSQARSFLAPLFGIDIKSYVVLFRITLLQTIEERYGEGAASDYQNFAAQFLTQSLRPEDRLFHWGRDVLMAVVRRLIPQGALRSEMDRLTLNSRGYVLDVDGKRIMTACPIAFDLLPVSQFPSLDEMIKAFNVRATKTDLIGMI
jgi:ActR/RegA family two-component response regulator